MHYFIYKDLPLPNSIGQFVFQIGFVVIVCGTILGIGYLISKVF